MKKEITTEKTYKRLFEKYLGKTPDTKKELVIESFKRFIGDTSSTTKIEDLKEKKVILSFSDFMTMKGKKQ